MVASSESGKIITFYSYKGGTGRSMMLANVAWILASKGNRVLVVDWDLEAPGLHRYFLPFLSDKDLTSSNGVIDFVIDFAVKAKERLQRSEPKQNTEDSEWLTPYANILRYASSLKWPFPSGGALDFVSAGRQGASYSMRVNSFNWHDLYELLGGRLFLEAVKRKMRSEYEYVLIDSRTGVSDTSGICTVQMPDILVTCFTLNNQSIEGASAVARSVDEQRQGTGLRIFPIPTRTDNAELEKRLLRMEYARDMFDSVLSHIPDQEREQYWGLVEIPYVPFYAYEEMLSTFRDRPGHQVGLLAPFERLTGYLTDGVVTSLSPPEESLGDNVLNQFNNETLFNYDVFISHAIEDREMAEMLAKRLSREKVGGRKLRIFGPSWDAKSGKSNSKKNQSALNRSRKMILLVSPSWVESEAIEKPVLTTASSAAETEKLIPLYCRDAELPVLLRPLRFIDFRIRAEFAANVEKLVEVIKDPYAADGLPTFEVALSTQSLSPPPDIGFVPRRDRDGHNLIEWLKEELAGKDLRAVVLWGAGGVGKTTLAAEAIRFLDGNINRRVIWVSTEEYAEPSFSNLLDDILTKLDQVAFRDSSSLQKMDQLRSVVSATTALIVLDGFEKLSSEEQSQIEKTLIKSPPCPLLITSRQRISSARNVLLSGFSLEETSEFIDRWVKVQTGKAEVFSKERTRIFHATEGIPLALQLLLGYLILERNPQLALSKLEKATGESIERSFNLSFESPVMDKDGRTTLLALSLFVPTASSQALLEVAGFRKSIRLEKALQKLKALRLAEEPGEKKRFLVHELIRSLSRVRLAENNEANQLQLRFISYFLQYTLAHDEPIQDDLDALETERDNILSAMSLAFEAHDWSRVVDFGKSIALPKRWLILRGYLDEAIRCCEQSMKAAGALRLHQEVVEFAVGAANIRSERHEYSKAVEIYVKALTVLREAKDNEGMAVILHHLGTLSTTLGNYDAANRHYVESLRLSRSNSEISVSNLASISEVALLQGDSEGAFVNLQEALSLAKARDDKPTIADYLARLGEIALRLTKEEEADRYLNESLGLFRELGLEDGVATALSRLGALSAKRGDIEESRHRYNESLEIEKKLGDRSGIAISLHGLGQLAQTQGQIEEARRFYHETLEIRERLGDQHGIAYTLYDLGVLAQTRRDLTESRQLYTECLDILRAIGDANGIARTLRQLGAISESEDDLREAARLYDEALNMVDESSSPLSYKLREDLHRVDQKAT